MGWLQGIAIIFIVIAFLNLKSNELNGKISKFTFTVITMIFIFLLIIIVTS